MTKIQLAAVGLFVLVTLALFGIGLFLIGERRLLFTQKIELFAEFARVSGLQPGAPVQVSGMTAGDVREIAVPVRPGGKFRVRFTVREDLQPLVRTDSVASIQTEGLVGGTFLAVAAGTEHAPPAVAGTVLRGREPFTVADLLEQMSSTILLVNETIADVKSDVEIALRAIADTATHADAVVQEVGADVAAIADSGRRIVADTQAIIADLEAGQGTAGRLLKDDTLYRQAADIMAQAQAATSEARKAVEEGRRALTSLNEGSGPAAQSIVADLRQTVQHARTAMANLEQNTEALKHNWFFRGFFRDRGYFDLDAITPAEYRRGALTEGGRRALRIWLKAEYLFDAAPGGELRLTDEGRARLDSAMSTFLAYPLDGPLMIEGYAVTGTRADDFRLARERAERVRTYLIDRYELDPQTVGLMPLAGPADGSPDGSQWDGVALALFVDREALDGEIAGRPEARPGAADGSQSVETTAPATPGR
jgi:phospholipid/cholesterol/gamma-HCH transport system substrate-binding protein